MKAKIYKKGTPVLVYLSKGVEGSVIKNGPFEYKKTTLLHPRRVRELARVS